MALVAYDVTDSNFSYERAQIWVDQLIEEYSVPPEFIVLVGTKKDLDAERKVLHEVWYQDAGRFYAEKEASCL